MDMVSLSNHEVRIDPSTARFRRAGCPIFIKKIFLIFILIITCACSSKLYHPDHVYRITPSQFKQIAPEEVVFHNKKGIPLTGWYFKSAKHPKGQIVFFHGNSENISTHFATLYWILNEGYDFFIFDYQGFGKSGGKPTPRGTLEDGEAALRWMQAKNSRVPLIVFGQSLGGAIGLRSVIEMKNKIPIKAVVLDSTFLSYKSAAASVLSHHWPTWPFQPLAYVLMSDHYAPKKRVREIAPIPLLIFHGDQDKVISYNRGKKIYDTALEPKTFITTPEGRHGDVFLNHGGKNRKLLLEWLRQLRLNY